MANLKSHAPTVQELDAARKAFEEGEPRDLFYRAATELVRLALQGKAELTLTEALAVLLQTWNQAYYRYTRFDSQHFSDLEQVVKRHEQDLEVLRSRTIESFTDEDETSVKRLFGDFEEVLGPVGAAKCLHLLAPRFLPLWDRAIAKGYELPLRRRGRNAARYCEFMRVTRRQCEALPSGEQALGRNPLKALDEYNYCKFTKRWL